MDNSFYTTLDPPKRPACRRCRPSPTTSRIFRRQGSGRKAWCLPNMCAALAPDRTACRWLMLSDAIFTTNKVRYLRPVRPLILAIEGNGYFLIETPEGERLTRAGHFITDGNSELVTPDGYRLLDAGGAPVFRTPGCRAPLRSQTMGH